MSATPKKLQVTQTTASEQAAEQTQRTPPAREFATPEELLRFDAAQTPVPPAVADKLQQSIQREPAPAPPQSWWRRWFTN